MARNTEAYSLLVQHLQKIQEYQSVMAVLSWDQETNMPLGGAGPRAALMSRLAGDVHDLSTSGELKRLLGKLDDSSVVVSEARRAYEREAKIPRPLATRAARVASASHQVWVRARARSDFRLAAPYLKEIVAISREMAERIGYVDHPYDALLDGYEPHARTRDVERIFQPLRGALVAIADRAGERPKLNVPMPDDRLIFRYSRDLLSRMGFDFTKGRIDESVHPFSTMFHPRDVRMTIRHEKKLFEVVGSVLHEGGHSLYSQGLPEKHWGTALGSAVSLGIHESQSRLWENQVGRSREFWRGEYPRLQKIAPSLKKVPIDKFLSATNAVRRSLIRVEADEVTYGLHIMLRFDLEKALITGELEARDIPSAWNDGMNRYLGIRPKNDTEGCLQDVHWYSGTIGYFPTYLLGNLYAAQFFDAYSKTHPWKKQLESGNLMTLSNWLRTKIHRHGSRYRASELVKRVTGKSLDANFFVQYLENRYR